jgi:hypothetical protein
MTDPCTVVIREVENTITTIVAQGPQGPPGPQGDKQEAALL